MKRFLCGILIVLLLAMVNGGIADGVNASSNPDLKFIWDAPFGISMDAFIQKVEKKTGYTLSRNILGAEKVKICGYPGLDNPKPFPNVLGYQVDHIQANFNVASYTENQTGETTVEHSDEGLRYLELSWKILNNTDADYVLAMFQDIGSKIFSQYLLTPDNDMTIMVDGKTYHCNATVNNQLNMAVVKQAISNKEESIGITQTANNIRLIFYALILGDYTFYGITFTEANEMNTKPSYDTVDYLTIATTPLPSNVGF